MASRKSDLFDDSVMSFGDHLEALRTHLWKSIGGLTISVLGCLYFGTEITAIIRTPIDRELTRYSTLEVKNDVDIKQSWSEMLWTQFNLDLLFGGQKKPQETLPEETPETAVVNEKAPVERQLVKIPARDFWTQLHRMNPEAFPKFDEKWAEKPVELRMDGQAMADLHEVVKRSRQAVTLNVQEAFVTYMKVSMIAGCIVASPWIFYQLWMFIAAGLYRHERGYVYIYGGISLFLFLLGIVFCFYAVLPFVLRFLLGFNFAMELAPQIRLSEWVSFAILLPVMFGVSFQLPLVMVFLEKITVFKVSDYREKRRLSILAIAFISMILTPSDPMSMLLMMCPLIALYEVGIWLCQLTPGAGLRPAV